MAGVAEPLLTGRLAPASPPFASRGRSTRWTSSRTCQAWISRTLGSPPWTRSESFWPDHAAFYVGLGSAAVPGVPSGQELQRRFGRLEMSDLVTPAAEAAAEGVP